MIAMILYGAPLSPYVRKVLAYAAEKGVELELVPVGMGDPNPDFIACSPFGKMPGFRDGDFRISDSTAIITYLEAKFPEPCNAPRRSGGARADNLVRGICRYDRDGRWRQDFLQPCRFPQIPGQAGG
jgi:glutathione S-transferase